MDPNAALKEFREIQERFNREEADEADLERAMDLFGALDEWLSRGGFLPEAWNR